MDKSVQQTAFEQSSISSIIKYQQADLKRLCGEMDLYELSHRLMHLKMSSLWKMLPFCSDLAYKLSNRTYTTIIGAKSVCRWQSSRVTIILPFGFKVSYHLLHKNSIKRSVCCAISTLFRTVWSTVYPKKYAHGFCFAVLCCGYTLTDFPISIRLTSLALWQSNDCPSASKATLMNMDK